MRRIALLRRAALLMLLLTRPAFAHDTWLETNTAVLRPGDSIEIRLMLGNHGNDHRDFKVAGKADLDGSAVQIIDAQGKPFDLKPSLVDVGYAPKEGFWIGQFEPTAPGLYLIWQHSDQVASYAPQRIVRSAKTLFQVSRSLDHVPADAKGFDRVLDDPLELVPLASTIAPMGPGVPIVVKLLYQGKPLAGERVSFIPRGQVLKNGFDPQFERRTDNAGVASFEPTAANEYLVVAHHDDPTAKGAGYDLTKYSATLTVRVPAMCPCCGE